MELLYGKPVADRIHIEIRERVARLGMAPGLAVVLVGTDPASHLYVSLKETAAEVDGLRFEKHFFTETIEEEEVIRCIEQLNSNDRVHGIIVQLPLPNGFDVNRIIGMINPKKDADGFHSHNVANFLAGDIDRIPVFPEALIELLLSSGETLAGEKAVVVANSEHFSQVMVQACTNQQLETTIVQSSTLVAAPETVLDARVIITACGIPNLIRGQNIISGVILIDGGIVKNVDGRTVGDVDAKSVEEKASYLAPVPGGAGPITIACLLRKVVALAELRNA